MKDEKPSRQGVSGFSPFILQSTHQDALESVSEDARAFLFDVYTIGGGTPHLKAKR